MKGFEIFFRKNTVYMAPEFGMSIFVYNRNSHYYIEASGLDDNLMSYKWIDSQMELGEIIEIEIKDINKSSEPIAKTIAFSAPVKADEKEVETINTERIEYFYALEKVLKAEGLV